MNNGETPVNGISDVHRRAAGEQGDNDIASPEGRNRPNSGVHPAQLCQPHKHGDNQEDSFQRIERVEYEKRSDPASQGGKGDEQGCKQESVANKGRVNGYPHVVEVVKERRISADGPGSKQTRGEETEEQGRIPA